MTMQDYKGPVWVAILTNLEETWTDTWYGDYDNFMNWIDSHGYEVVDIEEIFV